MSVSPTDNATENIIATLCETYIVFLNSLTIHAWDKSQVSTPDKRQVMPTKQQRTGPHPVCTHLRSALSKDPESGLQVFSHGVKDGIPAL